MQTNRPKRIGQILLIGDSTIRDVVSNDDKALYVVPRGGGKTGDILAMMKSVKPNTYTDVVIHVGTNDTSTKFPLEKIMTNMTNIIDTAKSISKSGHVTFSGICPRKDNDAAARKGDEVNGLLKDLCGEKGCVFIDHRDTFLRRNGDVIEDHLLMDGLHLSARGTRCLLENLSLSTKASGKLDGARPQGKGPWDGRPRGNTRGQSAPNQQTALASSKPPGLTQPQTRTSAPWQTNKPSAQYRHQDFTTYADARQVASSGKGFNDPSEHKKYCEWCGEGNHSRTNCKHRGPIQCHKCNRFSHKMKYCHMYNWLPGHDGQSGKLFDRPIPCEIDNPSRIPTKQRVLNEISTGIFWNQYKRLDSPRDGHCFIHTLVNSFNSQFPDKPCMFYNQLLEIIEEETLRNINMYSEFLETARVANCLIDQYHVRLIIRLEYRQNKEC